MKTELQGCDFAGRAARSGGGRLKSDEPQSPGAQRSSVGASENRPDFDYMRRWMHAGLHDLPADSAVLALGWDEASVAPHLVAYSNDVTVLDTSGGQRELLARRFPDVAFLQHKPASPLPFAHNTFDAIWCSEFLDRVLDPAAALREMHRLLVPGGRLMVAVADHGTVRNVLIALFRWEEHFALNNPRIRHFTRTMLARLAAEAEFEDVRISTGGHVRQIAGALVPRTLFLQARKGSAGEVLPGPAGTGRQLGKLPIAKDLAVASRTRAG